MNNSHVDPNISLGLNILDGVRASHADLGHKPFGVDGGSRTVQDMLRCSFMMAGALRDHGITGIYYQFPMLYYAYQQEKGTLPPYLLGWYQSVTPPAQVCKPVHEPWRVAYPKGVHQGPVSEEVGRCLQ